MATFALDGIRTAYQLVRRRHPMGTVEEDHPAAHRAADPAFHSIDLQYARILPDEQGAGAEPGQCRRGEGTVYRGPQHKVHPGSAGKADGGVHPGRPGVSGDAREFRLPHYERDPRPSGTWASKGY